MSHSEPAGRYVCPPTRWSLIERAGKKGEDARPYLAELLTRYRPAMLAHLVRRLHLRPDMAEEILQGFVLDKILNDGLISRADPSRGRFRNLVFTALNHYAADQIRKERAAKRHPGGVEIFSLSDETDVAGGDGLSSELFDTEWARRVLQEALRKTRAECECSGKARAWGTFEARVVKPLLEGAEPLPYQELVRQFDFNSPAQAHNALATAKDIFGGMLQAVIGEYADGHTAVEAEICYLGDVLAKWSTR